jgi:hypothetical protein
MGPYRRTLGVIIDSLIGCWGSGTKGGGSYLLLLRRQIPPGCWDEAELNLSTAVATYLRPPQIQPTPGKENRVNIQMPMSKCLILSIHRARP